MQISTLSPTTADHDAISALALDHKDLAIYFGSRSALSSQDVYAPLRAACPGAIILGCTTGGQIDGYEATDDHIACVAIRFDRTKLRLAHRTVGSALDARSCGEAIGEMLQAPDLAGIFVLSDGLNVNGSELIAGITQVVGNDVTLTGGLAGDGSSFEETMIGADGPPRGHMVAAVGFYGDAIQIGHGSAGGYDVFGPWRQVTRSAGNVMFELDGEPALDLYERIPDSARQNGVALLISCIGRRLLMGQRISEEIDAASDVLGEDYAKLGFYSYGEISPHSVSGVCELHNQTMTIATINEVLEDCDA